ncbi:hypothetical protein CAPTEDRAFT_218902 [Capitella teleta]|uniref:Uncharacterized protein n=1 Tax=Capitella teleta TaxID=283909 RepID=R7VCF2_CAPTE|nr:hypothetical protein CAPTEDRAFT_218902 [Capitella teleta]|eukprot:ELU16523.1 hypothetical protein CAPTEDRAFT_218902 [Capitella teleta]
MDVARPLALSKGCPTGYKWIWTYFNQCITKQNQLTGFVCGLTAIAVTILAHVCLAVVRHRLHTRPPYVSRSLTLIQAFFQILSRSAECLGCVFAHQFGTQICLSLYLVSSSVFFFAQWIYLQVARRHQWLACMSREEKIQADKWQKSYRSQLFSYRRLIPMAILPLTLTFGCYASWVFQESDKAAATGVYRSRTLLSKSIVYEEAEWLDMTGSEGTVAEMDKLSDEYNAGYCLGVVGAVFEILLIVPTLYQAVKGCGWTKLQVVYYMLSMVANALYAASIYCQEMSTDLFLHSLPWAAPRKQGIDGDQKRRHSDGDASDEGENEQLLFTTNEEEEEEAFARNEEEARQQDVEIAVGDLFQPEQKVNSAEQQAYEEQRVVFPQLHKQPEPRRQVQQQQQQQQQPKPQLQSKIDLPQIHQPLLPPRSPEPEFDADSDETISVDNGHMDDHDTASVDSVASTYKENDGRTSRGHSSASAALNWDFEDLESVQMNDDDYLSECGSITSSIEAAHPSQLSSGLEQIQSLIRNILDEHLPTESRLPPSTKIDKDAKDSVSKYMVLFNQENMMMSSVEDLTKIDVAGYSTDNNSVFWFTRRGSSDREASDTESALGDELLG